MSETNIPTTWFGSIPPYKGSLEDIQNELKEKRFYVQVDREIWRYYSALQSVLNYFRKNLGGMHGSLNPWYYEGTLIRINFYTYNDTIQENAPTRSIPISRTFHFDDCMLTISEVWQDQVQTQRQWVKLSITACFKDNLNSSKIDTVVAGAVSLLGIKAEGVIDVASGLAGAIIGLGDYFKESHHLFYDKRISNVSAEWVNRGAPSSRVVFGPEKVPPELCENLRKNTDENGDFVVPFKRD